MNLRLLVVVIAMNLGQLPVAMRPLLVTLLGSHVTGSFAVAGLAGGAAAVGMAVTSPWWSRALARFGDRRVLTVSCALFLVAQAALITARAPAAFVGVAALSGLCTPPAASSVRALLARLAPGERTRGYAVNAVAMETVYIAGPLWVTAWTALADPVVAVLATAACGALALAVAVPSVATGPHAPTPRGEPNTRPHALPVVRTLAGTYLGYWICMGAMWVLVPAFAQHSGQPGQAGVLVAIWSVGSLVGGLALVARPPRLPLRTTYLALLAVLTLTSLPLALPSGVTPMAVAIGGFGLALSPWLATGDQVVAAAVGEQRSAEVYGWLTTVGQLGGALGSALAGPLGDRHGGGPAFLLVTAALAVALVFALTRRQTLPTR
ncbi:MFS family permease [Saccharothrix coeruleofusca]|uniref:MFS transporter n=1 Tax=Saccharothrix coeruleofusca TaxID=33919 RepID=UPI001AE8F57C|nr:MFS transporter [Saccharothrix coeruleofusca]MBP2336414.1 MFS family permease [Saccharothrix coeruleofusca]